MTSRIVLFGATGYTGRLTAAELVLRGHSPVLAGRDPDRLADLASTIAIDRGLDLQTATADVTDPASVARLLNPGDVLISTVGPFGRWGKPAVEAVLANPGSVYLDSAGEPEFVRELFEEYSDQAISADATLVPAFGNEFVPGNLAGALALDRSGKAGSKVVVGYFLTGGGHGASGGTKATLAGTMLEPHFAFRGGHVTSERVASRVHTFDLGEGRSRTGMSLGSSEHLALPAMFPQLTDVEVYLGWLGPLSRAVRLGSMLTEIAVAIPGVRDAGEWAATKLVRGSSGGPDEASRAASGSLVVAEAYDSRGVRRSRVVLSGPNGYTLTARLLAWGAIRAVEGGVIARGTLGPAGAYGLTALAEGCADLGLVEAA